MKVFLSIVLLCFVLTGNAQHDWVRTNPGGGGAIATVGATASGMIVAASDLSGIYRSTDNGQTWDVVGANQGLEETHISSFGFDPTDGQVFFAGTYIGAYKTTDGGDHFTKVFPAASDNFDYSYIEDIAISASNPTIGYMTHHPSPEASGEVYKTTDAGETWQPIAGGDLRNDLHLIKIMIHPSDANIVYVLTGKSRWGCSEANLYRSTNGGVNWVEIGGTQGDILDMDLHPTDVDIVFISTFASLYEDNESCMYLDLESYYAEDETAGEFYKSIDGGASFVQIGDKTGIISVGIDNPDVIRLMDVLWPYDWNDDAGTWETTNGGTSWTHTGFRENWTQGYSENQYYAYSLSFNGLNKTVTKDIFNSDRYYGSYGQWAWGSFDGGVTFDNISTKEITPNHWLSTGVENINGHCLEINENNADVGYVGGYDIGFWYTTDHGASWVRTQPDYNLYSAYSWTLGDNPTENEAKRGAGANISTLLNDPERENVVWASFSKNQLTDPIEGVTANAGLFKSTNYGEDWELMSEGLPGFSESIRMYGLSMDKGSTTENRRMYVTVDGNIYRSETDGNTWELVLNNGGLKFTTVDNFDGNIVFAGGKNGLWRSTDAGDNWNEVGTTAMHNTNTNIRPDIVPTWTDWTDDEPTYAWEGVFDIQTDPNVANRLYVTVLGPDKGLYRSDDAGMNWTKLMTDTHMRGVAIAPENSNVIYVTSSKSYHSGGFGNSLGIMFSTDTGQTWAAANDGMAYNYGGTIKIEKGEHPYVWAWSPGTGVQRARVPFLSKLHGVATTEVLIYPNPTTGKITVPTECMHKYYEIISLQGQLLKKGKLASPTIDLSPLEKGMYFLKLLSNKGELAYLVKVVVQ